MELIKIEHVYKIFKQGTIEVKALQDICLEIKQGEFTALIGPSGSGKSTLLNCIGALDKPTTGEIFVNQVNINNLNKKGQYKFRLNEIGFVFQAYNLIPVLTAIENIEYILTLQKIPKKIIQEKSLRILKEVGLEDIKNRFPNELSGGQQQRVAVARALVSEPKIVLADEPTANLDSTNADILLGIMEGMCVEKKITFLFSTHDERVMKKAKRLIQLRDGKIVLSN